MYNSYQCAKLLANHSITIHYIVAGTLYGTGMVFTKYPMVSFYPGWRCSRLVVTQGTDKACFDRGFVCVCWCKCHFPSLNTIPKLGFGQCLRIRQLPLRKKCFSIGGISKNCLIWRRGCVCVYQFFASQNNVSLLSVSYLFQAVFFLCQSVTRRRKVFFYRRSLIPKNHCLHKNSHLYRFVSGCSMMSAALTGCYSTYNTLTIVIISWFLIALMPLLREKKICKSLRRVQYYPQKVNYGSHDPL